MSLPTLAAVVVGLAIVFALYRYFYRERGTDDRNWVNDSNYNIATSDKTEAVISDATPSESATVIAGAKQEGPYPPSEESFHDLRQNLGVTPKDSDDLKRELSA